jgi:hypothetical protein
MKIGDQVWVLCEVVEGAYRGCIECKNGSVCFRPLVSEVRPVEPEAVEQPTKRELTEAQKIAERTMKAIWAANDAINEPPVIKQSLAPDPVNPSHCKQESIECIEEIKAALGGGFTPYLWGNILKYTWRWPSKNGIEDLKKARWYLDRLIKEEEAK